MKTIWLLLFSSGPHFGPMLTIMSSCTPCNNHIVIQNEGKKWGKKRKKNDNVEDGVNEINNKIKITTIKRSVMIKKPELKVGLM